MNCRVRVLLILVLLVGCQRGPDKPPGLEGAGPLVAEFARVAKGLDDIAPRVAAWIDGGELPGALEGELPFAVVAEMTEVGEAARAVLDAAEPDGDAGAEALAQAVVEAADDVVRHLVTVAGGSEAGPGRMAVNSPGPVAFDTDSKDTPPYRSPFERPGRDRTELGKIEAQEGLEGELRGAIERFVYVVLLAHPGTRAALAPRLSPDDLPAEVPDDRNLPVDSRDDWQRKLFDDQNRLVVPSLDPVAYRSFIGWIEAVSPDLGFAASRLTDPAFRIVSG